MTWENDERLPAGERVNSIILGHQHRGKTPEKDDGRCEMQEASEVLGVMLMVNQRSAGVEHAAKECGRFSKRLHRACAAR